MNHGYRLTVIAPDGELIGVIDLDGVNLSNPAARVWLAEAVTDEMGGNHVKACAEREEAPNA